MLDFLPDNLSSEMNIIIGIVFLITGYFIKRTFESQQTLNKQILENMKIVTDKLAKMYTAIEVNKTKDEAIEKRLERLENGNK